MENRELKDNILLDKSFAFAVRIVNLYKYLCDVKIGKNCKVQSHSFICELVTICDNVVIGAGSVVTKNITESGIYVGNPAKKIRGIK